ncbi:hypothetical protein B0H13DRAFT_2487882 [Mycena leptocephala]|nr:hypothetical protein B0H13DRAFT_2487882 [Mycena leptocephala]
MAAIAPIVSIAGSDRKALRSWRSTWDHTPGNSNGSRETSRLLLYDKVDGVGPWYCSLALTMYGWSEKPILMYAVDRYQQEPVNKSIEDANLLTHPSSVSVWWYMGWPVTNRVLLNMLDTKKKRKKSLIRSAFARLEKDPVGFRAMRMNQLRDQFDYEQLHFVQVDPKSITGSIPPDWMDDPRIELVAVAFNDKPVLEATYGPIPPPDKLLEMEKYFGNKAMWGRDEVPASVTGMYGFELE